MNPVRILAGLAVVLAAAPLWFARAGDDQPASAQSAEATITPRPTSSWTSSPIARGRTLSPIVPSPMSSPRSRRPRRAASDRPRLAAAGGPRVWDGLGVRREIRDWKDLDDGTLALVQDTSDRMLRPSPRPSPATTAVPVVGAENPSR